MVIKPLKGLTIPNVQLISDSCYVDNLNSIMQQKMTIYFSFVKFFIKEHHLKV